MSESPAAASVQPEGRTENSPGLWKVMSSSLTVSYQWEKKVSPWAVLTLNAFTGAAPLCAVIPHEIKRSSSSIVLWIQLNISCMHEFRFRSQGKMSRGPVWKIKEPLRKRDWKAHEAVKQHLQLFWGISRNLKDSAERLDEKKYNPSAAR